MVKQKLVYDSLWLSFWEFQLKSKSSQWACRYHGDEVIFNAPLICMTGCFLQQIYTVFVWVLLFFLIFGHVWPSIQSSVDVTFCGLPVQFTDVYQNDVIKTMFNVATTVALVSGLNVVTNQIPQNRVRHWFKTNEQNSFRNIYFCGAIFEFIQLKKEAH